MSLRPVYAQILPVSIVQRILGFLNYRANAATTTQLLHVCSVWRSAILELLCAEYFLRVVGSSVQDEFTRWPTKLPQPGGACLGLVRTLRMDIDYNSIFNGKAVHAIYRLWNTRIVFPNVDEVQVCIRHNSNDRNLLMHDYDSHAHVFAKYIKQMVPKMTRVCVRYVSFTEVKDMVIGYSFDALITTLFHQAEYSALHLSFNDFVHSYQPQITHALSQIACCWNESYDQMVPLIHASSDTLLDLRITCYGLSRDKLHLLFVSPNNHYVIYHQLERLVFEKAACREDLYRPTLPQIKPLPKLQYLKLGILYPFGDDLLFRGNEDTLERLEVTPDLLMLQVLERHSVFQGNHHNLKHISVDPYEYPGDRDSAREGQMAAAIAQFVHRASPSPQTVEVQEYRAGQKLVCSIAHSMHMSTLQVLHIRHSPLTLTDIIALLQSLPLLSELSCICGGLGEEAIGVPLVRLAESMHQMHYPLSHTFTTWDVVHDYRMPLNHNKAVSDVVSCAWMLSIMCPSFVRASVGRLHRRRFNSLVNQAISMNSSAKYATHFNNLLIRQ
ncbi:hypothetical protein GGF46_002411 [Coemansia sp. RSA 552]|nr:hypothetical protein GGF46_002411 [Coemansia sp. RSA 552]